MKEAISREVILATDIFETENDPAPSSVAALNEWVSQQGFQIRPIYITAPSTADLSLGYVVPVKELEQKLEAHVKNLGFQPTLPAQVLIDDTCSRRGRIGCFLDYAEKEGAAAIALTSHGRSGIDRFMLGSFAEAVLRESPWPVFFLTSEEGWRPTRDQKRTIFFTTDFSAASREAFGQFLSRFHLGDSRVVIFHSVNFPVPYAPVGTEYVPENYFAEQEAWAKQMGAEWTALGKAAGVDTRADIRYGGMNMLTGKDVLAAARAEGSSLLVMATASGPVERTLLGSVAFDLFRARQVPVLVYGPMAVAAAKSAGKDNSDRRPATSSGRV